MIKIIKESKKQRNVYETWNLPAGNVNRGESIEEAMRRIIEEEAGLQGSNGFNKIFLFLENIFNREFNNKEVLLFYKFLTKSVPDFYLVFFGKGKFFGKRLFSGILPTIKVQTKT